MEQYRIKETHTYRVNRFLIEAKVIQWGKLSNLLNFRELECRGARIQIPAGLLLSLFPSLSLCGLSAESSMQERTQTGPYTGPLSVSSTNVRSHFIEEKAWMGSPRDSVADWGFLHSCCMMDKSQK